MDATITHPAGLPDLLAAVRSALATERSGSGAHPVWDRSAYVHLARRLGGERMSGFLAGLLDRLTNVRGLLLTSAPREEVLPELHDLRSVAGMLGFSEVLEVCTKIQAEAHDLQRRCRWPNLLGSIERANGLIDSFLGRRLGELNKGDGGLGTEAA